MHCALCIWTVCFDDHHLATAPHCNNKPRRITTGNTIRVSPTECQTGCDRPASCVEWRKTISVLAMFLLCSKFKPTYAWFPSRVRIQQRNASHRIAIIFRSTPAFRQQLERCCIFPQVPAAWPRDGGIAVRCVASRYAMMETKR